jgi:hypothetical protein
MHNRSSVVLELVFQFNSYIYTTYLVYIIYVQLFTRRIGVFRHLAELATNNRPKVVNIIYTGIPNWTINLTQYPWVWNIPGVALF